MAASGGGNQRECRNCVGRIFTTSYGGSSPLCKGCMGGAPAKPPKKGTAPINRECSSCNKIFSSRWRGPRPICGACHGGGLGAPPSGPAPAPTELMCAGPCGLKKTKDHYSGNQWGKGAGVARCKPCVKASEAEKKAAADAAAAAQQYQGPAVSDLATLCAAESFYSEATVHEADVLRMTKSGRATLLSEHELSAVIRTRVEAEITRKGTGVRVQTPKVAMNGMYQYVGLHEGKPAYRKGTTSYEIRWETTKIWRLTGSSGYLPDPRRDYYSKQDVDDAPNATAWFGKWASQEKVTVERQWAY